MTKVPDPSDTFSGHLQWPTGPTGSMTSSPCRKIRHILLYQCLTDEQPSLAPPLSRPSTHHSSSQPTDSKCTWTHKPLRRHFVLHPPMPGLPRPAASPRQVIHKESLTNQRRRRRTRAAPINPFVFSNIQPRRRPPSTGLLCPPTTNAPAGRTWTACAPPTRTWTLTCFQKISPF